MIVNSFCGQDNQVDFLKINTQSLILGKHYKQYTKKGIKLNRSQAWQISPREAVWSGEAVDEVML